MAKSGINLYPEISGSSYQSMAAYQWRGSQPIHQQHLAA